jgi:L-ascorbate metabolism protein UlaG (beta-lactamase superfamily)
VDRIPADVVLITHGHGDHVADAEAILRRTGAQLVTNYEIAIWFGNRGIGQGLGLNLGGAADVQGFRVKYVPALHSSQLPDGSCGGNPGGFVVGGPEGTFLHAGDTALTLDMQLLKRHQLAFAMLPIGGHFTMDAPEAAEAAQLMGVKKVLGMHYNTFPPITIDTALARTAFQKAGVELLLPAIGETIEMP